MAKIPKGLGSFKDLQKRFKKAQERWQLWRSLHQEAFDYAAPERENFRFRSPGQRKNRHIFDSTATMGLMQFASRIQGSLVPSWQNWMTLVAGDEIPEDQKNRVNEILGETTNTFFTNLNHSNFSTEVTPTFSDLGIGTGGIMIEEMPMASDVVLKFTNVPLSELYPETTAGGRIRSVWRKQRIEPRHILTTWPQADLPPELNRKVKAGDESEIEMLIGMLWTPEDNKYHQVVLYEPTKSTIFSQTFDTQRLIVTRWHVTPGETFGRGPIIQTLPDIRTVNKVKQFILENGAIQMAGMYTGISDGVFNPFTVRIAPGSIIPVASNNNANPTLRALTPSGDLRLGELIIADLQETIKKSLLVDPLGDITDPVRTATENIIRNQETLKLQGASIGRQKSEFIEPVVNAVIDILRTRGKIGPVTVDGRQVTIKQQSPLAKAEDLEDFQNSQVWFQSIAVLPPELVGGTVKVEDLPGFWAEKLGVPSKLIRNEAERKKVGEALLEAAQAQEGAQPPPQPPPTGG